MFRHKKIQKCQKTRKWPHKPPTNQKSNKESSGELMFKTINVQTHKVRKQRIKNLKKKLKNYPLKPPKKQISKKEGSNELMLKTKNYLAP